MRKISIAALAAASFLLAGCSGSPAPTSAPMAVETQEAAEFQKDFEEAEEPSGQSIQYGNLQAEFGSELTVDDFVIAARFDGSKTLDETAVEAEGEKVRIIEVQIENTGDSMLDASMSGLDSITTDKGSGRQEFDGSNDEPFFGQVGPGEKASIRLLVQIPDGATTATLTYTVAGESAAEPVVVHFNGPIEK